MDSDLILNPSVQADQIRARTPRGPLEAVSAGGDPCNSIHKHEIAAVGALAKAVSVNYPQLANEFIST